MNPLQTIWFFIFVLPVLLVREGYEKLTEGMNKEQKRRFWDKLLIILFVILCLIFTLLWFKGYR